MEFNTVVKHPLNSTPKLRKSGSAKKRKKKKISMLRTKIRLSTMAGAAAVSTPALSSSAALRNPSLSFPSSSRFLNGVLIGNRVSFSVGSAHASLRCYASLSALDRVKVQNPIVEMDGELEYLGGLSSLSDDYECRSFILLDLLSLFSLLFSLPLCI